LNFGLVIPRVALNDNAKTAYTKYPLRFWWPMPCMCLMPDLTPST